MSTQPEIATSTESFRAIELVNRAHILSERRQFSEARPLLEETLRLDPTLPMAHNNLGWVLQMLGEPDLAMSAYRNAISLNPLFDLPRRNLADLQFLCNQQDLAIKGYRDLVEIYPRDRTIRSEAFDLALKCRALEFASDCAQVLAEIDHGVGADRLVPVGRSVTVAKLEHDLEQMTYLAVTGKANELVLASIGPVRNALEELRASSQDRRPLSSFLDPEFRRTYNRLLQVRPTPRTTGTALSKSWNARDLEQRYIEGPDRYTVIDDFMTERALRELRDFCTESTIWFENKYDHGRLGAFIRSGFNCPLLLQIAEELRERMPKLIGERHELSFIWAFKYSRHQPATPPHADFAAVNVNFWITPDEANIDAEGGGMVIYNVEAPLGWSFEQYNSRGALIQSYVNHASTKTTRIPYRCNRAVIFHSDLFHATDEFNFEPGYENRRINITMLFGVREDER